MRLFHRIFPLLMSVSLLVGCSQTPKTSDTSSNNPQKDAFIAKTKSLLPHEYKYAKVIRDGYMRLTSERGTLAYFGTGLNEYYNPHKLFYCNYDELNGWNEVRINQDFHGDKNITEVCNLILVILNDKSAKLVFNTEPFMSASNSEIEFDEQSFSLRFYKKYNDEKARFVKYGYDRIPRDYRVYETNYTGEMEITIYFDQNNGCVSKYIQKSVLSCNYDNNDRMEYVTKTIDVTYQIEYSKDYIEPVTDDDRYVHFFNRLDNMIHR